MSLNLTPETEQTLLARARQSGMSAEDYLTWLLRYLPTPPPIQGPSPGTGLAGLLKARLLAEDTEDPDALQRAEAELNELKQALNETRRRSGAEPVF